MNAKSYLSYFLTLSLTLSAFSAQAQDLLNYKSLVNVNDYKGTPFFEVMKNVIKPQLDKFATEGFVVADGKTVIASLDNVDRKVSRDALSYTNNNQLSALADSLNAQGKITFYDLPAKIKTGDRYGLTTYFALVSGGGVGVKFSDEVLAYNVNYGTGKVDKDEMTGRSFGAAGTYHKAFDASDAAYLKSLEKIARPAIPDNGKEIINFSRAILDIITKSDGSSLSKLSNEGKAVASDFLAVYIAEQDRHLMANLKSHHWDSALLEVTLLAAFHAGQDKLTLIVEESQNKFKFTDKVTKQHKVTDTNPDLTLRDAGMIDYWQFSSNPENAGRSGINITRQSFQKLESAITKFEKANHPELVAAIEKIIGKSSFNTFDLVSDFLINFNTQAAVKANASTLTDAYVKFLEQVRKDAKLITSGMYAGQM